MKLAFLFWLIFPIVITVLISSATTTGYSSTLENNTVLQAAQKSLDANQKQSVTVSSESGASAFQLFHGTSMVQRVFFTWVIISSDNELSVNLRYGDLGGGGTSPPVTIIATALTKGADGKSGTMKGSVNLNAGWISPNTVPIQMNGESSLYDATSINVVASPLGTSPPPSPIPMPSPPTSSPPSISPQSNDIEVTSSPSVKPQGVLKVLSSNAFTDSLGYLHVVGEIQNGTPDSVTYVKATATFYDKNNNVVATDYSFTSPSDLGPGDTAPFEIILTSASIPVKQIHHRTIIASSG